MQYTKPLYLVKSSKCSPRERSEFTGCIFPHARWLKFARKRLQHPPHQAYHHPHRSIPTRKAGNLLLQLPTPTWLPCTHLVAAATQAASAVPSTHKASPNSQLMSQWSRDSTGTASCSAHTASSQSHIFLIPECTFPCRICYVSPIVSSQKHQCSVLQSSWILDSFLGMQFNSNQLCSRKSSTFFMQTEQLQILASDSHMTHEVY